VNGEVLRLLSSSAAMIYVAADAAQANPVAALGTQGARSGALHRNRGSLVLFPPLLVG
jgi:hypothetical protein